jgi:uracil phosphoribosyltransferase
MDLNFPNQLVTVCEHPLIQHNLSIIRDKQSNHEMFRIGIRKIAQYVLHEATRSLPLSEVMIQTPLTDCIAKKISSDIPIIVIPILRAGLMMCDAAIDMIPSARIYHVGLYRDEKTLQPVTYYNKLPAELHYENAHIIILDPMLATGGSISCAIEMIKKLGAQEHNIQIASIISAPEGIKSITTQYPKIKIYTGAMDHCLNEKAYIVPGLGDAGDRAFGTV